MFQTDIDHNHTIVVASICGIPAAAKAAIGELFDLGITTPQQILNGLAKKGIDAPTKMQLNNYLKEYKKKKFGNSTISLGNNLSLNKNIVFYLFKQYIFQSIY